MSDSQLAQYIDHTLLKPYATHDQIVTLCQEAKTYGFAAVCVHPFWVDVCDEALRDSSIGIATVIGFPHGANDPMTKAFETRNAIASGATEVDMVINIGALQSQDEQTVQHDIEAVVKAARRKAHVKVIIETSLLTDEEKRQACRLARAAGADYVKTSTGFNGGGATTEDVALMYQAVDGQLGVKASGGIKNYESAKQMIDAGASRIGASSGIAIVSQSE